MAALALLGLAACNGGSALVTLTATPASITGFLTYRVQLVSVAIVDSKGNNTQQILKSPVTVDLAQLSNFSEVLGSPNATKGSYGNVAVTIDYSNAQIVADNGTASGVPLKPVNTSGAALGQVSLTVALDSTAQFSVASKDIALLALSVSMSETNDVDLSAGTVTVTPMISGSSVPIDSKPIRIRGILQSVDTSNTSYNSGITPFDGLSTSYGTLNITPTAVTTFEINGAPSTGTIGLNQLAALPSNSWLTTYATVTSANGSTSYANVSFGATQVYAGSSVQGGGSDRITGVVTAIDPAANTVTVPTATLLTNAGADSFLSGTTTISLGADTSVTLPQQGSPETNSIQQVSVGSVISAFGTATTLGDGDAALDAASGRVRLDYTTASGLVTVQGTSSLTLDLTNNGRLGNRLIKAFNFSGTGNQTASPAVPDSVPSAYNVTTAALDLTYATVGMPVEATGLVTPYSQLPPDLSATALLDPTTIPAELVIDWGAGTPTPFNTYSSTDIDIARHNTAIGLRHQVTQGAQVFNIQSLPSDPLIQPSTAVTTLVYSIGHESTSIIDNFNTFADFIAALQVELNGTTLATHMTATGVYTSTSYTLAATNITIYLNI